MLKMHKKAQIFSTDLIISAAIFMILISFVFFTFSRYQTKIDDSIRIQDMNLKALQITELLVKSSGEPVNWEENVSKLNIAGLVSSDRRLLESKITEFIELEYNTTKEKLKIMPYEFYFALKEINGGVAKINGEEAEKGIKPNLTSKNVLTIKRMVLYGQNEKIIEFTIWE